MLPREIPDDYNNPNTKPAPGEAPAEPVKDGQGSPPSAQDEPKSDPKRTRAIAWMGVKARHKASNGNALLEWVDNGAANDRTEWRKLYSEQPPEETMAEVRTSLKSILDKTHEAELWLKVDELFKTLEK